MIIPFKDKAILVTGGTGFIGSNLCDFLIRACPKRLIIFDNLSASDYKNIEPIINHTGVEFIKGDIRDYELIEKYILVSDIVFHLAASNVGNSILNPKIDLETNIVGTFNVLQAIIKKPDIRLVHVSSGSISNPSTPYAISKLTGEQYCLFYAKEYGLNISVVRPYHVFGPKQDMNGRCGVINIFLSKILKDEPPVVWGKGDAIKCFTFVNDLVDALIMVAENTETIGNIYDVASDTRINIEYLARLLIEKYALDKKIKHIFGKPKIGENAALFPDTTKIKELGWKTNYTFEQGLDITKKWVEEQLL